MTSRPTDRPRASGADALDATTPDEIRDRRVAILLFSLCMLLFAALDATAKWLVAFLPVLQIVWMRYAVATALSIVIANPFRHPRLLVPARPWLQLFRSAMLLASTTGNFLALRDLQLAETNAIGFSMPLLVALIGGPLIGEWVGPRRLIAIMIGFIGVLFVVQPGAQGLKPGVAFALAGVCAYSLYVIATRAVASTDDSRTTMIYSNAFGALALAAPALLDWTAPRDFLAWAMLVMTGVYGGLGHGLLVLAAARAPAAVVAPFSYQQIIWMTGLGYLVFGDTPGLHTSIGATIVVCSGLYLLYRERVRQVPVIMPPRI